MVGHIAIILLAPIVPIIVETIVVIIIIIETVVLHGLIIIQNIVIIKTKNVLKFVKDVRRESVFVLSQDLLFLDLRYLSILIKTIAKTQIVIPCLSLILPKARTKIVLLFRKKIEKIDMLEKIETTEKIMMIAMIGTN